MRLWRRGRTYALHLLMMVRTDAPAYVVVKYILCIFDRRRHRRYKPRQDAFRQRARTLDTSNDWFTGKIPSWLDTFDRCGLRTRETVRGLEIGSYHGMSAIFVLEELPNASMVCVDMWKEPSGSEDAGVAADREDKFDRNTAYLADRITKFKGSSFSFFERHRDDYEFDFIYIDGSVAADDVLMDAVMSFAMLRPGGVLILDDYMYRLRRPFSDGPGAAINAFLRLKRGQYDLIYVGDQMQIQKRVT